MLSKYNLVVLMVIGIGTIVLLSTIVLQTVYATGVEQDIYDQWTTISEFEEVSSLRKFLIEKDWIEKTVTVDELDYILVLTRQCSEEFFPSLPTSLILSIISVESGFDPEARGLSKDSGLMQIIPYYHDERIEKYIYNEKVDLFDPRVNVMVGMDILDELVDWSDEDIELAVMAYNMGQEKAKLVYKNGIITSYAKNVISRMNDIERFFERRRWPCS